MCSIAQVLPKMSLEFFGNFHFCKNSSDEKGSWRWGQMWDPNHPIFRATPSFTTGSKFLSDVFFFFFFSFFWGSAWSANCVNGASHLPRHPSARCFVLFCVGKMQVFQHTCHDVSQCWKPQLQWHTLSGARHRPKWWPTAKAVQPLVPCFRPLDYHWEIYLCFHHKWSRYFLWRETKQWNKSAHVDLGFHILSWEKRMWLRNLQLCLGLVMKTPVLDVRHGIQDGSSVPISPFWAC